MSYLALYRKYRPDTFDKLIGQEHIVKTLVNQIETGRIGHAYLFTGTRGTARLGSQNIRPRHKLSFADKRFALRQVRGMYRAFRPFQYRYIGDRRGFQQRR